VFFISSFCDVGVFIKIVPRSGARSSSLLEHSEKFEKAFDRLYHQESYFRKCFGEDDKGKRLTVCCLLGMSWIIASNLNDTCTGNLVANMLTLVKDTLEDLYLAEDTLEDEYDFDILAWWKTNSSNIGYFLSWLMITSGCVLDVFRSSLSPEMVEALICTQNWLNLVGLKFYDKDFDQFDSIEKIIGDVFDKIPQSQGVNEETTTMNID
ncbi:hypothetical protein Lal_00031522, partial [Lupinus albus]